MALEPGFFAPLARAFAAVPDLFCATAQIRFPAGVRREETGKAVFAPRGPRDFPVRCDEPLEGEDLSWVLYGSGGCSLYYAAKLRALGGVNEAYAPAYVEDLDLGYRAWQQGWPSVFVAGARVEHQHRATTSRYYTEEELSRILEINWLRFLAGAVASPKLFRGMWRAAALRLRLLGRADALEQAWRMPPAVEQPAARRVRGRVVPGAGKRQSGGVSGPGAAGKPAVLVASPYVPFPLSHGGAVRIYNLMRRAAADFDQVLVAFTRTACAAAAGAARDLRGGGAGGAAGKRTRRRRAASPKWWRSSAPPPSARRFSRPCASGGRRWRSSSSPRWRSTPAIARPRAPCWWSTTSPSTFTSSSRAKRETGRRAGNSNAGAASRRRRGASVDRVVTMSGERPAAGGRRAGGGAARTASISTASGPRGRAPEPRRLLFIGSFAHLPNAMAAGFFLNEVWPLLEDVTLHIIAGARHEQYLAQLSGRTWRGRASNSRASWRTCGRPTNARRW